MNQVIIVTGPAGAGKTVVAEAICERFDRMLHVPVDTLRHWVKAGYRHPGVGDERDDEQMLLAVRNASAIARNSIAMRYAVVIDDVLVAHVAGWYRDALEGIPTAVQLVTLLPDLETTLARDAVRRHPIPDRVRALHEQFAREIAEGALPGAVIDSTHDENAYLTADRVMDAVATGEALFIAPPAG